MKIKILSLMTIFALAVGWYKLQGEEKVENSQTNLDTRVNTLQKPEQLIIKKTEKKMNAEAQTAVALTKPVIELSEIAQEDIEIKDEREFSGISRLSEKSESVLKTAGLLPNDLDNAAFVEFDLDALRVLEVGDTFELDIPQTTENFSAEVTQVDTFDNGDKSIIGSVTGLNGQFHTTVITVGKGALYGQFTTLSGNWVFESKDQYGWIAAKRDLYKNHVEFEPVRTGSISKGADDIFAPKLEKENTTQL